MVDLTDFIKVAKEAQNSIEEMKNKTKNVIQTIDQHNQNSYEAIYKFMSYMCDTCKELELMGRYNRMKTSLYPGSDGISIYFQLCQSYPAENPQIGIYKGDPDNDKFYGWIEFYPDYKKFKSRLPARIESRVLEIIDSWAENNYEEILAEDLKEHITQKLALRIDECKMEHEKAVKDLACRQKGNEL